MTTTTMAPEKKAATDPALIPDSWKPAPSAAPSGDRIGNKVPPCDFTDPADLEAWYGNFGFFDHFRRVVVDNCAGIERAKAVSEQTKITEERLKQLAHTNAIYVDFLITHLEGRILRERNVRQSLGVAA